MMIAPGVVMLACFLTSRRTLPDGQVRDTHFGISALWQRRPEGWRMVHAHEPTVSR